MWVSNVYPWANCHWELKSGRVTVKFEGASTRGDLKNIQKYFYEIKNNSFSDSSRFVQISALVLLGNLERKGKERNLRLQQNKRGSQIHCQKERCFVKETRQLNTLFLIQLGDRDTYLNSSINLIKQNIIFTIHSLV